MTSQDLQNKTNLILKMNGYNPITTQYLNIVNLIPKELDFIWDIFSDGCPFSFGDNNVTLVDAITIRNWVNEIYDLYDDKPKSKKAEKAIKKFTELMNLCFDAQVYINVE